MLYPGPRTAEVDRSPTSRHRGGDMADDACRGTDPLRSMPCGRYGGYLPGGVASCTLVAAAMAQPFPVRVNTSVNSPLPGGRLPSGASAERSRTHAAWHSATSAPMALASIPLMTRRLPDRALAKTALCPASIPARPRMRAPKIVTNSASSVNSLAKLCAGSSCTPGGRPEPLPASRAYAGARADATRPPALPVVPACVHAGSYPS